jgi:hypothetical protein
MEASNEQTGTYCLNCAQKRCYWHIKIPIIVEVNSEESNSKSEADGKSESNSEMEANQSVKEIDIRVLKRTMKEEEICKRELGKMIESQVGKQNFSCIAPDICKCKCKKFKYKKIKDFSRGAAIVGLVVAGTGCIVGAFLVTTLTFGAGIVAAPPMIFGGIGLITGALYEFGRGRSRRFRKRSLMACYKGKLLDPLDYGIDIYVEGATPLRTIITEDMSEVFLSSSEVTNANRVHQPEKTTNSGQQSCIQTNSPYVIQLPYPRPNYDGPQPNRAPSQRDLVYQSEYMTTKIQPINYESTSPFQTNVINQFPSPQQLHLTQNNSISSIAQENNNHNNTYPLRWSEQFQLEQQNYSCTVPCYFQPTDDNNMLQQQYVNPPYLRQQSSDI